MAKIENLFLEAEQIIEKAKRKLKSALILSDKGQTEDVISRSYYAVFHAAKALLLIVGERPRTHNGTLTLFGLKLIKENVVDKKLGKILSEQFQARQVDDYELFSYYEDSELQHFLTDADYFIKESEKYLKKMKNNILNSKNSNQSS